MNRGTRDVLEATLGHDALVDHIARISSGQGDYRRRFRVEETDLGNSRLVSYDEARRTVVEYGGVIHEIVESVHLPGARHLPTCPRCKTAAGDPCFTRKVGCHECHHPGEKGGILWCRGHVRGPHKKRLELVRPVADDWGRISCPHCKRPEYRVCVAPTGGPKRKPHGDRVRAYEKAVLATVCPVCHACDEPCTRGNDSAPGDPHKRRVALVDEEAARRTWHEYRDAQTGLS